MHYSAAKNATLSAVISAVFVFAALLVFAPPVCDGERSGCAIEVGVVYCPSLCSSLLIDFQDEAEHVILTGSLATFTCVEDFRNLQVCISEMLKNSYCILLFYFSLSQFHLVFFRKLL
jgi:hypothetical protein